MNTDMVGRIPAGTLCALLAVTLLACARTLPDSPSAPPSGDGWGSDYEGALAAARAANKLVLADFTGSDWCSWCRKLHSEVFETDTFRQWAARHVILLELDYPRHTEQGEGLRLQNARLLNKAQVEGFPTVVFWDAAGKEVGRMGYVPGGPDKWIEHADAVIAAAH
ncbi:MAG: thioredoxin family protein [Planctomycetota bacterium]